MGTQLRKIGGFNSQPLIFGSSVANGNSHKIGILRLVTL